VERDRAISQMAPAIEIAAAGFLREWRSGLFN
jgi:hypothetical protein